MTTTPNIVTRIRDELDERRERRNAANKLHRELATYTTLADVNDLLAAIGDQDTADAEDIRSILLSNLARTRARRLCAS